MKKFTIIALLISLMVVGDIQAQTKTDTYISFSSEMIFSFASIDHYGYDKGNRMRWSPVLNLQGMGNIDLTAADQA